MTTTSLSAGNLNAAVGGVLTKMFYGIAATLVAAAAIAETGLTAVLFQGLLGYAIIFLPLLMSFFLMWKGDKLSEQGIKMWYFAFAAAMGVSLSLIFAVYTSASIVLALFGTTVSFGALAFWGYFTKRDLSSWGSFLFAGVIGLIVASVVGVFLDSTALQMTINVLAIIIFLAMTAYDMNRIRDLFWNCSVGEIGRMQWFGALSLYINFINIFISLVQLIGDRK